MTTKPLDDKYIAQAKAYWKNGGYDKQAIRCIAELMQELDEAKTRLKELEKDEQIANLVTQFFDACDNGQDVVIPYNDLWDLYGFE